jgi:hypothetical protein
MNPEKQAELLARWLADPSSGPPEGVDADALESVYALRPELAPAPRVSVEDILSGVRAGPLARVDDAIPAAVTSAAKAHPANATGSSGRKWWLVGGGASASMVLAATVLIVAKVGLQANEQAFESTPAVVSGPADIALDHKAAERRAENLGQPVSAKPLARAPQAPRSPAPAPAPAVVDLPEVEREIAEQVYRKAPAGRSSATAASEAVTPEGQRQHLEALGYAEVGDEVIPEVADARRDASPVALGGESAAGGPSGGFLDQDAHRSQAKAEQPEVAFSEPSPEPPPPVSAPSVELADSPDDAVESISRKKSRARPGGGLGFGGKSQGPSPAKEPSIVAAPMQDLEEEEADKEDDGGAVVSLRSQSIPQDLNPNWRTIRTRAVGEAVQAERELAAGNALAAETLARSALSLMGGNSPTRAWMFVLLGDALALQGDSYGANQAYGQAIELNRTR